MPRERTGEKVVQSLFGATLAEQGRGFYITLELLALLKGTQTSSGEILPVQKDPLRIERRAHDFARRLMAEPCALADSEREALGSKEFETLRALALGLRVPVPGRRKRPKWQGEHLFPYVGELIHYDAAVRRKRRNDDDPTDFRVSIERYTYRGAGGLVHKILRIDTDHDRLERNRRGLANLIEDSNGPLGRLFDAMMAHDLGSEDSPFEDDLEANTKVYETEWTEQLRNGVCRLVERKRPTAKIIESLMYWVPFCVARHQLQLACNETGDESIPIPIAMGESRGIRRVSREVHDDCRNAIVRALNKRAAAEHPGLLKDRKTMKWRDTSRNFFSATLGTVGALNAMQGRRHFTMKPQLLEAVVLACLDRPEISFEQFCRTTLFRELNVVVDRLSASECDRLSDMNLSDFEENAQRMASALASLGHLHQYSDMTKMVRVEVD
jgi:hypothetical protein